VKPGLVSSLPHVVLQPDAATVILAEAQVSADGRETGGILLGSVEGGRAVIRHAGRRGPAAVRSSVFFLRDLLHARQLAQHVYDVDGSVWIGEWHTHPGGGAHPSEADLRTYARHLADRELGFAVFVSFIVTPGPAGWDTPVLNAWMCADGLARPVTVRITNHLLHSPTEQEVVS
jgi:integrative and conjugative element protein (TIGR02256 family)